MKDDSHEFIGVRARTLAHIEREFMQQKGIRLPDELTTDDVIVDTDLYDNSE